MVGPWALPAAVDVCSKAASLGWTCTQCPVPVLFPFFFFFFTKQDLWGLALVLATPLVYHCPGPSQWKPSLGSFALISLGVILPLSHQLRLLSGPCQARIRPVSFEILDEFLAFRSGSSFTFIIILLAIACFPEGEIWLTTAVRPLLTLGILPKWSQVTLQPPITTSFFFTPLRYYILVFWRAS